MSTQLSLIEPVQPPTTTIPLKQALEEWAVVWSVRLDKTIVVSGNPWAGWTLRPKDAS